MRIVDGAFYAGMTLLVTASSAAAQSIGGTYDARGTNLDGSPYVGTATITLTSSTTCDIKWTTGGTTSQGICMRNGPSFAASYVLGRSIGLVIYNVMPDGSLDGLWTVAGAEGAGTEVLTPR
jgi:hypothetical protein